MTPFEKGRFCSACKKNVYDFSRSTEEEYNEIVEKEGPVCGRFREDQIAPRKPVKPLVWTRFRKYLASTSAVFLFKMLSLQSAVAQSVRENGRTVEVEFPDLNAKKVFKGNQVIRGKVEKLRWREELVGLSGVQVSLKNLDGNVLAQTQTNSDGEYEMVVPDTVNYSQELFVVVEKESEISSGGGYRYHYRTLEKEVSLEDFIEVNFIMKVVERKRLFRREHAFSTSW